MSAEPPWLRSTALAASDRGEISSWGGAGVTGQELDKLADTLLLFFRSGRKFNAHTMSGMHDPDQAFGVNLHVGGAQSRDRQPRTAEKEIRSPHSSRPG